MRLSVLAVFALPIPLLACRFDFDPVPATPKDAPLLPCGSPPEFSLVAPPGAGSGSAAVTLSALAVTASDPGYELFAVDGTGAVHGYSFGFDGPQLVMDTANAPVFSDASGAIAAVETPDGPLAAIEHGQTNPDGTALVPLDAQLAPRAALQTSLAWLSLDSALAVTTGGEIAFLGAQNSGGAVAKRVSSAGADLGASHLVAEVAEGVSVATIAPAAAGYLVTWTSTAPTVNLVRAEILDSNLSVVVPPTTINPNPMFDGDSPRAGYAASAGLFLIAWSFKTSNSDELWVSLRDGQLAEQHAIRLSMHGVQPRVVAGKDDFLVAWKDNSGDMPSGLAAARVGFDGSFDSLVVAGSGGKAAGWDLATRAGQPALVWIETSASTVALRLDPLCN